MKKLLLAAVAACAVMSGAQAATFNTLTGEAPVIIAHRGASGYLPEHSLAAYELGIKMGAQYIEPDLGMTKDGVLVAMHDTTLTRTTNVRDLFPGRDSYAVSDFTLAEIKQLTALPTRTATNEYPGFTPSMPNAFEVPTFKEVLTFLNDYNAANGTNIGIYPEAKTPNRTEMNLKIVAELRDAGFTSADDKVFIQSFSFDAIREIGAIQNSIGSDMKLVLLGGAVTVDGIFGIAEASGGFLSLADAALISQGLGVTLGSATLNADWIAAAHDLGLEVHGWTFRPTTEEQAFAQFQPYIDMGMDGFFTDYPDLGRLVVDANVAPVPLPAPAALLVVSLAGLAAMRRRRAAA
jgi:glycerophosphoryl diester phosphodiesterase